MSRQTFVIAAAVLGVVSLTSGFTASSTTAAFTGTQPQLAAIGRRVYLAFGLQNTISVVRSDDMGETFGAPVRLPASGRLSLGMHRGPRVAATNSAVLVTAIAGAKGGGADGDVLLFRSSDGGVSWTQPVVVNDVPGSAREGLQSIAARPSGLVVIAWLDLRDKGTRIYAAVSRDDGVTWAQDRLVYAAPSGSVCECCHPSVAISSQDRVGVMFRNNVDGHRDMYVAKSTTDGRFEAPARLGTESWLLNACPMDGGGLAFIGTDLVATWRRETSVFLTTSQVAERRLGTGRDPAIGVAGSHFDVAWSSSAGIMLARGDGQPVTIGPGRFPAVLAFQDKTILASENEGAIDVRAIAR